MTDKEKNILQTELYKLSPSAQEILRKLLEPFDTPIQNTMSVTAAKTFLAEQTSLPMYALSVDKDLIEELNVAVHVLRQDFGVWLSLDNLPHEIWCDIENYVGFYPKTANLPFTGDGLNRRYSLDI